jgi:hypothetical protein
VDDLGGEQPFVRLYRVLSFLHGVVLRHGEAPQALRLDDLLLRQIAQVLAPALLAEPATPDPRQGGSRFDELLERSGRTTPGVASSTPSRRASAAGRCSICVVNGSGGPAIASCKPRPAPR